MTEKMDRVLRMLAAKVGSDPFLKTISEAFNLLMPIVTVGGIFTLLSDLNIQIYQDFIVDTGLKPLMSLPSKFTVDLVSPYLAFAAGCSFLKIKGKAADGFFAGLTSTVCFFLMIFSGNGTADGPLLTESFLESLGVRGLFTGLFTGICTGVIWDCFTGGNQSSGTPDAVSAAGARFIKSLVPGVAAVTLCLTVSGLIAKVTGRSFDQWLYGMLSSPLRALSGNLFTYCALMFLSDVFWFFGIHGAQITNPFFMVLFMAAGIGNQAAWASGRPAENIVTTGLLSYLILGGAGNTAGLAVNMLLFSKSRRYKTLGKLAILPSLRNTNEPILFGMPLILNLSMALPFFVLPQITIILTYMAMSAGLVELPRLAMGMPGTPLLLDGFLMCGISGMLWQLLLIGITCAGYYPFFRIQDENARREEQGDMP